MPRDAEYAELISRYDRNRLCDLWEAISVGDTPDWEPGKALEYLVIRAFELEGAEVQWPYRVALGAEDRGPVEQIDGVVYVEGLACLVESKDQEERVNIEPIAKLRNQLLRRPGAAIGTVISRSGFTDPAMTLARYVNPQTILLWDGEELAYALSKQRMRASLVAKYRYCVERGLPFYNIAAEGLP